MDFSFRFAFSHHLAARRNVETLLLHVTDSLGRSGYGQVLPRDYLTGETLESAVHDLATRWWPALTHLSLPLTAGHEELSRALQPLFLEADALRRNASFAGIDTALHALVAQNRPRPAAAAGRVVPLVGVIDAGGPGKAAWQARALRWLGYRRFKVKVGTDAAGDAGRLDAVRRVVGPGSWLAVDANGAWSWDEAVERMRGLARWQVAVVEEPLAAAAQADFRRLEEEGGLPVMADESLCTLADARSLLRRGSPGWWNIRVAKNGGLTGAGEIARLAREAGRRVYGGVLVGETGALAAAGREMLFRCGAECGEYGFARILLKGDPFRGGPAGYRGQYAGPGEWGKIRLSPTPAHRHGTILLSLQR